MTAVTSSSVVALSPSVLSAYAHPVPISQGVPVGAVPIGAIASRQYALQTMYPNAYTGTLGGWAQLNPGMVPWGGRVGWGMPQYAPGVGPYGYGAAAWSPYAVDPSYYSGLSGLWHRLFG